MLNDVKQKTKYYKQLFIKEQEDLKSIHFIKIAKKSQVGENSIPICADITKFNFD